MPAKHGRAIGVRGIYSRLDLTDPTPASPRRRPANTCFAPVNGPCWLGDLSGLQSARLLPHSRRAELLGLSLLLVARPMAPVANRRLVQRTAGREVVLALKPNRVLASVPDTFLSVIAERLRHHRADLCATEKTLKLATYETDCHPWLGDPQPAGWTPRHHGFGHPAQPQPATASR